MDTDRPSQTDTMIARRGRLVAVVIAATMLLWLGAMWAGPRLGLPGRYALLIDLIALAALVWCLFNIYLMRRARRESQGRM